MAFRFATVALALLATAPAAAQTGSGQKEADHTTIEAEVIEGVSDLEVTARGNAEIRRDDITIFGEHLRFNRELGRAEADGGVRLQRGADRFFGPRLQYNTLDDTGVFDSPQYLIERDRTARGSAERLEFLGRERYRLSNATYTTCRPGQEDWRVEAKELELDFEEEEGEAQSARLRFFDTTILYTPYAIFPIGDRRKSGLLAPYYAQSSSRGFEYGIPYYWNIAPEYDATFTPVYMGKRGLQLKNQFRYLGRPLAGDLRFEYLPDDKEAGTSREGVSWQHSHRFGGGLTGQVDYNRVSDDRYFVDFASQVKQISVGNLPQDANLTQRGEFGGRAPYSLQLRYQRFQTLQDPLAPTDPPFHRTPQINFNGAYNDFAGTLDAALPAEFVRFTHTPGGGFGAKTEGDRWGTNPNLSVPLLAPGWFITPKAGVRNVAYNATRVPTPIDPSTDPGPQVSVPWMSLDSGLIFERESNLFGRGSTQTLEPRLYYVYVRYRNQDALPIFDTALADFNYAQLFTENRFVGGDRFGDAKQATLALTSRFLRSEGQEVLRATVAQRYYFAAEQVGIPGVPLRSSSDSDVLASIGARPSRAWTFEVSTQYNRHEQITERFSTSVSYRPEIAKVLNASYRYNRAAIDQVDLSAQWPVYPGWYAVARYNYSFLDRRLLDGLAGFEYNAGCWVLRVVGQRIQAAADVASTSLILQIEFSGIGSIGTDEAVDLLKRNLPGYSVTNPSSARLAPPSATPSLPFERVY